MADRRAPGGSTRRSLSLFIIILGALLLLFVPSMLVFLAFARQGIELPGTLVILSATGGMALVAIGAALRD